ncbi:MAG TPA: ATP-binding cassette domain-containing protein [Ignavibacteriaceae bacterium]|nr:ATP-binding cassette domain-containing protein [Ignavibacteriaceae bacterium]
MLTFENTTFGYNGHSIVKDVNLNITQGEFNFLIGKSGAGKSTLLKLVYADILPTSGNINFLQYDYNKLKNKNIPLIRRKIGVIFQDFKLLKDRNIFDNLAFVMEVTNTPKSKIKKRVDEVLADVGLTHKKRHLPEQLSGGELQRAAIARAIINEPMLVLADEPTGNLDPETTAEIMEIILRIYKRGTTFLFATHNYDLVNKYTFPVYKIENQKLLKMR